MSNETAVTDVRRQYAAAYAAHYTERDLPAALQLYRKVMASHPSALEAGYSRAQIHNIVNAVVPKQEIQDAQIELALGPPWVGTLFAARQVSVQQLVEDSPC